MSTLILNTFNTAMDRFSKYEQQLLRAKFTDPLLQAFLEAQADAAKEQMVALDPAKIPSEKAAEFLQTVKDTRLIWQFWQDLSFFVKDWAKPW